MTDQADTVTGSCLCGGVAYKVRAFNGSVAACHCTQCRKTSGHYVAATRARKADLEMLSDETLTWYRSSDAAERGFCGRCGGNVFWREVGGDNISIMAGLLDAPTGLTLDRHIFVPDAGDYYALSDGLPQYQASDRD